MKMKKGILGISFALCLSLGLAACGNGAEKMTETEAERASEEVTEDAANETAEPTTADAAAKPEEGARTLTIIHVNDIHGYVEETDTAIGYPKIAAYIEAMKQEDPNILALDAGDTFAGAPNAAFDKGESVAEVMNTIAFDAFTAGNNDFYIGTEQLKKLTDSLNYPTLAGNVIDEDGNYPWERHLTVSMDNGLTVGIVSATCGFGDGLEFLDPVEELQKQVDEIRSQVDIVLALVHLGVDDDSGNTSVKVANEVTGIDVIIDAHSHTVLEEGMVENGILIAQTGEYSNNIGVVNLTVHDSGEIEAAAHLVTKEEMAAAAEKEDTKAVLTTLLEKSDEFFSQVIGETLVDLDGSRDNIRTGETNMGDLVADIIREETGADLAFAVSGTIGGEILAGEITKADVLAIARVSVDYAIYEIKGEEILTILNEMCNMYPESSGAFTQVSGISFKIDPVQPEGERIHSVKVGSADIKAETVYQLAASSQAMNERSAVLINDDFAPSEVIIEKYITENSPIDISTSGRITEEAK